MGNNRPVKTTHFIKFLLAHGFTRKSSSGGSHTSYTKKGIIRPIVIREADKEIPALHIHTNARTIGVTVKDVLEWIEKEC